MKIYNLFSATIGANGGSIPFSFVLPEYTGKGEIICYMQRKGTAIREGKVSFTQNRNEVLADRLAVV